MRFILKHSTNEDWQMTRDRHKMHAQLAIIHSRDNSQDILTSMRLSRSQYVWRGVDHGKGVHRDQPFQNLEAIINAFFEWLVYHVTKLTIFIT